MFIDFENRKKNTFKTRQRSKYVQFRHKLVWNSSPTLDPPKNSFIVQKSKQTLELHQIQIHQVDLRARFSNLVDLLKRCFTKLKLVELEKKYPPLPLITQTYKFIMFLPHLFFFSRRTTPPDHYSLGTLPCQSASRLHPVCSPRSSTVSAV